MNYEIVTLAKKIVVGVSATSSNSDPNMGEIISGLWEKLYQSGVNAAFKNKVNEHAIGLYSDASNGLQLYAGVVARSHCAPITWLK